jgi:hypothetical protein
MDYLDVNSCHTTHYLSGLFHIGNANRLLWTLTVSKGMLFWLFWANGRAYGGAFGWGTVLQAGWSRVQIFDGVIGIFHWHNHSGFVMALGLTRPLNSNEYQEYFLQSKGSWNVGLTTLPPSCANYLEIWEPQPPGTLKVCKGLALLFYWASGIFFCYKCSTFFCCMF